MVREIQTVKYGLRELLGATHAIIADCPCTDGCPLCVQSPKCGSNNVPLDKYAIFLTDYTNGL